MRVLFLAILVQCLVLSTAPAETVRVQAAADATLIEDPDGAWANGSGVAIFAGRTNQGSDSIRRALVYFEVSGVVPAGAIIESARVELYLTPSHADPLPVSLHRVLSAWTEGPSASSGGGGRPSQPGDVTWVHTSFDTSWWPRPGGHFVRHASSETEVAGEGFYAWTGSDLASDIRAWTAAPERNFGWILVADETDGGTSKRFASREEADTSLRPALEITYRLPRGRQE